MTTAVPQTHRDLLDRPIHAVLTTMMPNGQPQSTLVWCAYQDGHLLVSTTLERRKAKNMAANPRVTVLVIDPADSTRYLEVRGHMVSMSQTGAIELADRLTQLYTGKDRFYGDIYPVEQQGRETRIVCRIRPIKVNINAVFQ